MDMISKLLEEFNNSKVNYVHWKSNTNIDNALSGIDDFDILVSPNDRVNVEKYLANLKIVRALSVKDNWQDNVFHYIGFDYENLKLVHIHLHYALPIGYDYDKNYVLPITDKYLTKPIKYKNVFLPEVEKEYIILVLRLILKHALTPFLLHLPMRQIKLILSAKNDGVIHGSGYKEYLDLKSRSNQERIMEIVTNDYPFLSIDIFKECENVLDNNKSLVSYFLVARKLKNQLGDYKNNSESKSFLLSFMRINKERINKITCKVNGKNKNKKLPFNGGKIITFVGGDGAGKTTNIKKLKKQLIRHFYVETVHIGRPPRSVLGTIWKVTSKIAAVAKCHDLSKALFYLSWAQDRLAAFRYACKIRSQGGIVILDRLPLPGITSMDCPRVHSVANGFYNRLGIFEQNIYKKITGVDLLFVLKLDPEIALKRRCEDEPNELRVRSGQIWNNDWYAPFAVEINTGINSFEEVEKKILKNVGNLLATPFIRAEVLGIAGSGKSTTITALAKQLPNLSNTMPFYEFPLRSFIGVIKGFDTSMKLFFSTKDIQVLLNSFQFYSSIEIINYWNINKISPSTNYVFDQGPVFQLMLLIKEGVIDNSLTLEYLKVIESEFIQLFFIDVNNNILWERIRKRNNHTGRLQEVKQRADFDILVSKYMLAFDSLIANANNMNRISSIDLDVDDLCKIIINKIKI